MKFNTIFSLFIITLSFIIQINAGYNPRSKKSEVDILGQVESVYTLVYDHYSDILEDYYKLNSILPTEHDYYIKKLLNTITNNVINNKLPLYGNCFSRFWRNITTFDAKTVPLKKFDYTSLEDAMGHIEKNYQKLAKKGLKDQKVEDLLVSLNCIRNLIRDSLEYKYEELYLKLIDTENELASQKAISEGLRQELRVEREKNNKEKNVIYKVTTIESRI